MQCCGPSICEQSKEDFVCQAVKLLPAFQGRLDPNGKFLTLFCCLVELFYECVVLFVCSLEKEFSPCTSEIYFQQWVQEYGLPFRCPLDGIAADLEQELLRLQVSPFMNRRKILI